jgi:predicted nucleic acid-binding protein
VTSYLVDTNVISAGSPTRGKAQPLVVWMEAHSADLYLSVVSVAEIEDGIAKLRRERASRKAAELRAWLDALLLPS